MRNDNSICLREKIATVLLAIMSSDNAPMCHQRLFAENLSQSFHHLLCACCCFLMIFFYFNIFFCSIIARLIEKIYNLTCIPVCRKNRLFDDGWKVTSKGPVWYGFLFIWIELRFHEPLTHLIIHCACVCMYVSLSLPRPASQCVRVHLVHITFILWSHSTLLIFHHDVIRFGLLLVWVCAHESFDVRIYLNWIRSHEYGMVAWSCCLRSYMSAIGLCVSFVCLDYAVCVLACLCVYGPEYVNFFGEGVCIYTYVLIIDSFIQIRIIDTCSRPLV